MKAFLLSLSLLFPLASLAESYTLPKPKTLGPLKHEVIYYSPKINEIYRDEKALWLERIVILQWGTEVFERGVVTYYCKIGETRCLIHKFERVATYKKCVVKNDSARCYGKLSSNDGSGIPDDGRDDRGGGRYYDDNEHERNRRGEDETPNPHLDDSPEDRYDPPDDGEGYPVMPNL